MGFSLLLQLLGVLLLSTGCVQRTVQEDMHSVPNLEGLELAEEDSQGALEQAKQVEHESKEALLKTKIRRGELARLTKEALEQGLKKNDTVAYNQCVEALDKYLELCLGEDLGGLFPLTKELRQAALTPASWPQRVKQFFQRMASMRKVHKNYKALWHIHHQELTKAWNEVKAYREALPKEQRENLDERLKDLTRVLHGEEERQALNLIYAKLYPDEYQALKDFSQRYVTTLSLIPIYLFIFIVLLG